MAGWNSDKFSSGPAHLDALAAFHASLDATRDILLAGDPEKLIDAFPDGVRIDDPRAGRIEGRHALEAYGESSAAWIAERKVKASTLAATAAQSRVVSEFELKLTWSSLARMS